ncbi:MAG: hypothetical protein RLY89_2914, partial [Bacteroidota bacterium]
KTSVGLVLVCAEICIEHKVIMRKNIHPFAGRIVLWWIDLFRMAGLGIEFRGFSL